MPYAYHEPWFTLLYLYLGPLFFPIPQRRQQWPQVIETLRAPCCASSVIPTSPAKHRRLELEQFRMVKRVVKLLVNYC